MCRRKNELTMKAYFKNWDLMRVLRLALGIIIIMQGVQTREWSFVVLGGLFSLMPLMNIGCCGASRCNTVAPKRNQKNEEIEEIIYEEIK